MIEINIEKLAKEIYYQIILEKNIPILQKIKKGKIRVLENEEIEKFLKGD